MNSTYILYLRFINSLLAVFLGVVFPIFLDILFLAHTPSVMNFFCYHYCSLLFANEMKH